MPAVDENLRHRGAPAALDHHFALGVIAVDGDLVKRRALAVQQRLGAMAERTGRFGVDINVSLGLPPQIG